VTLVLVAALVAPAAGSLTAVVIPDRATLALRAGALVAAASWLLLLAARSGPTAGRFHASPLAAAAALGACLIVAAADPALVERPLFVGVALAAAQLGLTAGEQAVNGPGLLAGTAVAVATVSWAARPPARAWVAHVRPRWLVLGGAGVVAGAVGIVVLRAAADSWSLTPAGASPHRGAGALLLLGAALLVLCGSERARSPAALLVPVGLFLGAASAPVARGGAGWVPAALVLAAAACAAALAARSGRPVVDRPTAALALLSLAAAVGPGSSGAAGLLLGGGATLAAALGVPASAALAVPGGVALAIALVSRGGPAALTEGLLGAAGGVALAAAASRAGMPARPSTWTWPAVAAAGWLAVAPGSWTWTGPAGLRAYDLGAAAATAGAGLCLATVELRRRVPARWYARPSSQAAEDALHH
jgi:hypothetical protein